MRFKVDENLPAELASDLIAVPGDRGMLSLIVPHQDALLLHKRGQWAALSHLSR